MSSFVAVLQELDHRNLSGRIDALTCMPLYKSDVFWFNPEASWGVRGSIEDRTNTLVGDIVERHF